jgi:hypothetical protein
MVSIRITPPRVSALLLVGAAAFSVAPAFAQSVTRSSTDRISVEAQSLPIGRVLRDMLAVAPIEALMIDPKVENHFVTVHIYDVSAGEAINQVLADSNLPFLVWGGAKGPWRIFVGDKDAALRVTSGSSLPGGGSITPQNREAEERVLEAERRETEAREENLKPVAMAERQAEAKPIVVMDDPGVPGGYTMIGESVIYNDPSFVPYKNRPEVVARRMATDVALIP